MHKRYWLPVIVIVGLAIAAGANAQSVIKPNIGTSSAAQSHAAQQTESNSAISSPLQDGLNRIGSALETANNQKPLREETERAKQDLDAQLRMARSADRMFWVGLTETVITFFGVMLVLATLLYTKKAADAANAAVVEARKATEVSRDIGQAQIRAYLSCEDSRFEIYDGAFSCWPIFRNTGQSPARKVQFNADVNVWDREMAKRCEAEYKWGTAPPIGAGASANGLLSVVARDFKGPATAFLEEGVHVSIRGIVTWTDVFGVEDAMAFSLTQINVSEVMGPASYHFRQGHVGARNRTPMTQEEWDQDEAFLATAERTDD
jgi:hypothetical protein